MQAGRQAVPAGGGGQWEGGWGGGGGWDGAGAESATARRGTAHLMGAMPGRQAAQETEFDNWGEEGEEGTANLSEVWAPAAGGVELENPLHKLIRCGARPSSPSGERGPECLAPHAANAAPRDWGFGAGSIASRRACCVRQCRSWGAGGRWAIVRATANAPSGGRLFRVVGIASSWG